MRPRNVFLKKSVTNINKKSYKMKKSEKYFKNISRMKSIGELNLTKKKASERIFYFFTGIKLTCSIFCRLE
jgi:hypothetical protein